MSTPPVDGRIIRSIATKQAMHFTVNRELDVALHQKIARRLATLIDPGARPRIAQVISGDFP